MYNNKNVLEWRYSKKNNTKIRRSQIVYDKNKIDRENNPFKTIKLLISRSKITATTIRLINHNRNYTNVKFR